MREMNRKTATRLLLVQWSRFQNECIRLEGSTLITGVNGTGKTTVLDAMTYLLTGNTQFNKAARDRDRTVIGYVRGDTRSNGADRYLRKGEIVSYIAMEFWSPVENAYLVTGVCIESASEVSYKSSWFVCRNTRIEQMNFTAVEGNIIRFTPRQELAVNGQRLKASDFLGRDRGVEQVLRALGLRCDPVKYRSKLLKMMAFNPENNIDQFIQECVLEPGKVDSLQELREQRRQFEHIREMYENLQKSKNQLAAVEQKTLEYEKKVRSLHIRRLMLSYQQLRETQEEAREIGNRLEELRYHLTALEQRRKELNEKYEAASERRRAAENNSTFQDMNNSIQLLERQVRQQEEDLARYEEKTAALKRLQMQMAQLLEWAEDFVPVEEETRQYLGLLAEKGYQEEKKRQTFLSFAGMMENQRELLHDEEVHCSDRERELKKELEELEEIIRRLKANQLVFPRPVEQAKQLIGEEFRRRGIRSEVRIFAELVQEVTDEAWRAAVETFLGRKRYHIIVDGPCCHQAMEILKQKALHEVHVVITDKLPDTQAAPGSAAELLTVPNLYARRYANYLLNGIHLCDSLEELHEYPKGGLMRNGMLAKSYAVSYMDTGKTSFCLGQDAVRIQLEQAETEKGEKTARLRLAKEETARNRKYRKIDIRIGGMPAIMISPPPTGWSRQPGSWKSGKTDWRRSGATRILQPFSRSSRTPEKPVKGCAEMWTASPSRSAPARIRSQAERNGRKPSPGRFTSRPGSMRRPAPATRKRSAPWRKNMNGCGRTKKAAGR